MEIPTLERLKEIGYKYYPQGLEDYEDGYDMTPENIRLNQKINYYRKQKLAWENFMVRLNELGFQTEDMSFFSKDRCFSCRFFIKGQYEKFSIISMSFLIPSFFFYHNKLSSHKSGVELNISPDIMNKKQEIILCLKKNFGELYEFPYEYSSFDLKNVSYGNNGKVDRLVEFTGHPAISSFTLFNAFFSEHYIFG